jgi:hypothetical protein
MAFNPLSPLGVAATTVQFISFTQNLVRRTVLKDGQLEAKAQNFERDIVTRELAHLSRQLSLQDDLNTASDEASDSLKAIANECQQVAEELLSVLRQIESPKKKHSHRAVTSKKLANFRLALASFWSEGKIVQLETRLDRFRKQLVLNLLVSLR